METPTISSNGQKLLSFLDEKMYDGSFSNADLVQFIESVGNYLNLKNNFVHFNYEKTHPHNTTKSKQNISDLPNTCSYLKFVL
jgi:hypothetical protein